MTSGAVVPNDLDAEASVLSSVMLKPDSLDAVVDRLRVEHFYSEPNAAIYEAALDLAKAGQPIDAVTIAGWLKDRGKLQACGGAAYLAQIIDATPAVHHIEAHADHVRALARLRKLISEAHAIAARGYSAAADVQGYLDQAAATVAAIAEDGHASTMVTMSDAVTQTYKQISDAAHRGSRMTGIESGFPTLDKLTCGWQRGEQYVIAGRPGMGKSAFMMCTAAAVASHWARHPDTGADFYGQVVVVFSLEMSRQLLIKRHLSSEARVDGNAVRSNTLTQEDWGKLTVAAKTMSGLPFYIDDASKPSPIEIRAKCRRIAAEAERYGRRLSLVCIDYAQLVDGRPMVGKGETREREVAQISGAFKRLAKELDVPVLLLAQLKRPAQSTAVVPKEPALEDLRESGSLEQDADGVIFIHREEYYLRDKTPQDKRGVARIILAKQRNGPDGVATLKFDGRYTLFSEPENQWGHQ